MSWITYVGIQKKASGFKQNCFIYCIICECLQISVNMTALVVVVTLFHSRIITITAFMSSQNINYTIVVIVHNIDPAIHHIVESTEHLCIIFTACPKYF